MRASVLILVLASSSYAASVVDLIDTTAAYRFLNHSTFGASQTEAARLQSLGYNKWIDEQLSMNVSDYPDNLTQIAVEWSQNYFFQNAMGRRTSSANAPRSPCTRSSWSRPWTSIRPMPWSVT